MRSRSHAGDGSIHTRQIIAGTVQYIQRSNEPAALMKAGSGSIVHVRTFVGGDQGGDSDFYFFFVAVSGLCAMLEVSSLDSTP